MKDELLKQGVDPALLKLVDEYVKDHPLKPEEAVRWKKPQFLYYGKAVWEDAITAILAGENILLTGPKATGKNVLAENLAYLFHRPSWTVSFHINTDASTLIGMDTFKGGEVTFRKGPILACAEHGGYGILDEVNMARNDAVAVLHAALDFRRFIDLPGYQRIFLREETRFIATMNYGYIGTRELNEALTSRFLIVQVPSIEKDELVDLLKGQYPSVKKEWMDQFASLFRDLQKKADNAEITTKPVDLRGLLASIRLMELGLSPFRALELGVVNKSFDPFEKDLVRDVIALRIPKNLESEELFKK